MDYGVFNVRTDVNACDCAGGCMTTKESLHRKFTGRKIPCRTGESNLRRRRAGTMLYQPNYISTPLGGVKEMKAFVGMKALGMKNIKAI